MPKVFISHSSDQKSNETSRKIAELLNRDGAEVWIDYARIRGGETLPEKIGEAIEWCDTLVMIWSKTASKSTWVKEEWTATFTLKKTIIPCILDETELPTLLKNRLYINFQNIDTGYNQLCKALNLEMIPEIARVSSSFDLKLIVRDAVKFVFPKWSIHPHFPDGLYIAEVEDMSKKKFFVTTIYIDPKKAINFSSEQVEESNAFSKDMGYPLLVASNTKGLTAKAEEKSDESKAIILLGSNLSDFIQQFKDIANIERKESKSRPFVIISYIEIENRYQLRNIGDSPAFKVKIDDVSIIEEKDFKLSYIFQEIDIIPPNEEKEVQVLFQDSSGLREPGTFEMGALLSRSAVRTHNLLIKYTDMNNKMFHTQGKWGKGGIIISHP